MSFDYILANHNKASHEVYASVPEICRILLEEIPALAGIVFGGSYASGKYGDEDDIDMDILFKNYPEDQLAIQTKIERAFLGKGLKAHVRAPLAASTLPQYMRTTLYTKHLSSPYAVRSQEVADAWGLNTG